LAMTRRLADVDSGRLRQEDHGMSRPGEPVIGGPGVPHWWWRWTPPGRRRMAQLWNEAAVQWRTWEVEGLPQDFVSPPDGYARRGAEGAEQMARVWTGPLRRQLLR
jgi:hypothetical protein